MVDILLQDSSSSAVAVLCVPACICFLEPQQPAQAVMVKLLLLLLLNAGETFGP